MPKRFLPRHPNLPSRAHSNPARASAHQANSKYSSASARAVMCTSRGPAAAPANGFAALHVTRLCAESSNENDAGANADDENDGGPLPGQHAGPEFVDGYFHRAAPSIELSLPAEEEGAGGLGHPPGSPLPFSNS
jgi:hypothetical protein